MAKDEIVRTAIGAAESVAVSVKQSEVSALLKKKAVEVAEKDKVTDDKATDEAAAEGQAPAEGQAVEVADASDSLGIASDAGISPSVLLSGASGASDASGENGISTTTLLVGGGVLLAGAAIAIASNSDDNDKDDDVVVPPSVTSVVGSVDAANEGSVVTFTVKGTPGANFAYTLGGTATQGTDYTIAPAGSITFDAAGNAVVTVTIINDALKEGAETITLTAGGQSDSITINDTSLPLPQNFVLTVNPDLLDIPATNGADVINGTVGGETPTFSAGDVINGNGDTTLRLVAVDDGTAAFAKIDNVAAINIESDVEGTLQFIASDWTNVGAVNLQGSSLSSNSVNVITELGAGTDLSVASGSEFGNNNIVSALAVVYDDESLAVLAANGQGSKVSYVDDVITGNGVKDGINVVAVGAAGGPLGTGLINGLVGFPLASPGVGDGVPVNVTSATLVGDDADLGVAAIFQLGAVGAPITVGDVSVTGYNIAAAVVVGAGHTDLSGPVDVSVGNVTVANVGATDIPDAAVIVIANGLPQPTLANANDASRNLTVGNVALTVADGDAMLDGQGALLITNVGVNADPGDSVTVGNTLVGNVSASVGDNTQLVSVIGAIGGASVSGDSTVGTTTVGDISIVQGDESLAVFAAGAIAAAEVGNVNLGLTTLGDVGFAVGEASEAQLVLGAAGVAGTGDVVVAGLTIGDVDLSVGPNTDSQFVAVIGAAAAVTNGAGDASLGPVSISSVSLVQGTDSDAALQIAAVASVGTGLATIESFDLGDVNLSVGINAQLSGNILVSATGDTSEVGDVSIGNVILTADDGADYATNGAFQIGVASFAGTLGDVTIASISSTAGVSATGDVEVSISASGDIGEVRVGDVTFNAGLSSSISSTISVTSFNGNVGGVTIGDVDLTAAEGSRAYLYVDLDAEGTLGNVSVGDVTGTAGVDASVSFTLSATSVGSIGNVTVGDVDLAAIGEGASASFSVTLTTTNTGLTNSIGDIEIGTIGMEVLGDDAFGKVYFNAYAADIIGSVAIDGLNLSIGNDGDPATAATATLSVTISSSADVTIGDVSLVGSTVLAVPGDANTYQAIFNVNVTGDLTVGDIKVSGGDGSADNFSSFDGMFASASVGGDLLIASIDYSDYGFEADIDLSAIDGVVTGAITVNAVLGSDFNDLFTDIGGKTIYTGNEGDDEFLFSTANTALTAAAADQITDFTTGEDFFNAQIADGTVDTDEYGEGVFASFEAFLAQANDAVDAATPDEIFVGIVSGSGAFVAVNFDGDNDIDYVVQLTNVTALGQIDVADFNP